MFDYNRMIKRAIEFFPQWSDIRKRHNTSMGGRLMSSIVEESIKTEDAIQEYIDSYFLYNYIGHEDEVMAFVYMAHIGDIDDYIESLNIRVRYNNMDVTFEPNIKEFEKNDSHIFYEEGMIYLKEGMYVKDVDQIEVTIDNITSMYPLNRIHTWNIFDEFATFVNTRRYENETNKQLVDRIMYITKNLPNGTEEGLKHAIISELMTDFPDLTLDDIKIENPTPENLLKAYEDYETLLDMLANINRDVYRTKRWDIDCWKYDFESLSYIPHIWDKAIKYWQNGVGTLNDLEVILADESKTTNAEIYFYKKTLEAFQKYVYDKHIENNIQFTLTKYNDILNSKKILYKIQASELRDISYDNVQLKIYESKKRTTEIPVQEVASGWGKDIIKRDESQKSETDFNNYMLDFKSKTGYDLIIQKADVVYTNVNTGEVEAIMDLLDKDVPGFVYNSEYELVSTSNKVSIESIENFNSTTNLKNLDGRITLEDGYNDGQGTYILKDKAGLYVNCKYSCQTVKLPDTLVVCPGGYWNNDNEFVVRGDYSIEDKVLAITIDANYLSFKIDNSANSKLSMTIEDEEYGTQESRIDNEKFIEVKRTSKPRRIKILINVLSINDVKFSDFKYSNYTVDLKTKYGTLENVNIDKDGNFDLRYRLGNFYNNELNLIISAKSGCAPLIEGIYIGENFENIVYRTDVIPYRNNCTRTFMIKSNGTLNLLPLFENSTEVDESRITYDFKPITIYKATSDNAYIRIDLSEYESIDNITLDNGSIETIEESGVYYYNIKLLNGDEVGTITIEGTKSVEAREVTLRDLVKFYVDDFNPTYDKIYCSKISKGLVIGRQNPGGTPYNLLININSDAFTGINAVKYEMVLPSYLGSIYGNYGGGENRSKISKNHFDYISIYPEGSQIYQAVNEYETCIRDNRRIKITNNFSPDLNTNKLLFYAVSNYDDTAKEEDIVIRFHNDTNENLNIYDLPSWSIGTSNSYIAIQNNIDMLNDVSYNITSYDVNDVCFLSSTVDIKDSYTLTDLTILNTEKYIVSTNNKDVEIKYDYYNGTVDKQHLLKYEEIIVESDGFNKLNYSNIDRIFHISKAPFVDEYVQEIIDFDLLDEQGIIVWKDANLIKNNTKLFLVYSIKKPIAFVFGLDYLYDAVDYDVNAYELFSKYEEENIKDKDELYLTRYSDYEDADLVYISCSNPTFESQLDQLNIAKVTFNKYTEKNTLLVKTGYYYINGREYYLFSEEESDELKNNKLLSLSNVDISGGELTTYKATNNYIANSEMRLKGIAELYNFDCSKPLTYGVSSFNSLTSCDSFNNWNVFGTELTLVEGLNGLALNFKPIIDNGYAYIEITDYLIDDEQNYISFFASKGLKTYLGVEEKYLYINFSRSLNIKLDREIEFEESDIRHTIVNSKNNYRYYLIVQAEGIIDDIVISTDKDSVYKSHTKNISLLGFDLYEKKAEGSRYKMMIRTDKDYTPYLAGLMSDGSFKTTSNIDWYVTEIIKLESGNDFRNCKLHNIGVENEYVYTTSREGTIETNPIHIGDVDNIKRLIFKINNIDFINMKNFDMIIETSDKYNGTYTPCGSTFRSNKFHIDQQFLKSYIKFKVTVPAYKFIDNISIFAEYISTDDNPLKLIAKQSGYIESKIYDLQETTNCFVKSIDIDDISNINDVSIYIRSSRDDDRLDIWNDWNELKLNNDYSIKNIINFNNVRFLQFKIVLKTRKAYIKLKGINIEIK